MYASNNTFTSLPETVGKLKFLSVVDIRHNRLTNLPSSTGQWTNIEYLYIAGNPLCGTLNIPSHLKAAKGLCKKQCAVDCIDYWLGNNICDDNDYTYFYLKRFDPIVKPKPNAGCNTAMCEYDKGDCPQ